MLPRCAIVAGGFATDIRVLRVKLLVSQSTEDVALVKDFRTAIGKEPVAGRFYCQNSPELRGTDFGKVQRIRQTFLVKGRSMACEFIAHDGLLGKQETLMYLF